MSNANLPSPAVFSRIPIAVAVLTKDGLIHTLPPPHRHHHVVHTLALTEDTNKTATAIIEARGQQGFLMNDGTFANRLEAADCALLAGRITKLQHPPYLYSEDLW